MTARAVAGEKFRTLRERVILQKGERAFARNAAAGEMLHPLGVALRFYHRGAEARVIPILRFRQKGQQPGAKQNNRQEREIETMPELPITNERHDDKDQQRNRRNDNRADNLGAAGEIFQELEQE